MLQVALNYQVLLHLYIPPIPVAHRNQLSTNNIINNNLIPTHKPKDYISPSIYKIIKQ